MLFITEKEFEYKQLWEYIKHNSNLAYTVLGLSLPASAYILYIVKFGVGSTINLSLNEIIFLAILSIFIAIAGYGIHARLNYVNDRFEIRTIEIEKEMGMYVSRLVIHNEEKNLRPTLKEKVENLDRKKLHWSEKPFRNLRITYWYLAYIFLLVLAWLILIFYNPPQDSTNTALANLSMADGDFIIGNVANNTNSTIKIDNFTVNIR